MPTSLAVSSQLVTLTTGMSISWAGEEKKIDRPLFARLTSCKGDWSRYN